jgi:hypothetical protein
MEKSLFILLVMLFYTRVLASPTEVGEISYKYELCYCGTHYIHEAMRSTPPLNVFSFDRHFFHLTADLTSEFLSSFETVHEFTYLEWETDWHHTLIIWTEASVYNFSFVALGFCDTVEQPYFVHEELLTIDVFLPTDALILNVAFAHYLYPAAALIFIDGNGIQRHMFIAEDLDMQIPSGCVFNRFDLVPRDVPHDEESYFSWWVGWDWE